ncbi:manganese superoxide dismutase [Moesziomyces antarcticus T-34]|uniref:Superoxide dismutase n=1 Tax=Pseudozyma antarctica (strain T-34) TaxID=1151754 RepID=M9LQG0_PSEA3|nr:manganese superoxide dismutase [Moesziomyces antarcticus T-34]
MLRTALTRSTRALPASTRGLAASVRAKHTLPDLAYDYGALEPSISGQIMELHHTKHHQTYVNGLNTAEDQLAEALHNKDVKSAIALQKAINFNGGGHINHTLFWENLAPKKNGGGELSNGALKDAIDRDFGSLDGLKQKFNAQIAAIQGSGWGWLGYNPQTKKLDIVTTANQDPLLYISDFTMHRSPCSPDRRGRMGARILPAVPERQGRLLQGHLGGDQLQGCRGASPEGPVDAAVPRRLRMRN